MDSKQYPPAYDSTSVPHVHQPQPQMQPQVQILQFGPVPQHIQCPSCHARITSNTETEPSTKTHLFALLLCLFGCWCCCCIPYCVDSCQSVKHTCPSCGAYLGIYSN